ncbi:formylmethanofuran dehydrogenase subunit C [Aquisphaera insulae]|uniref:formylmethanofuran dehydrogenase subunit C n=1 Tax=Aquisphaera insulae TaxID=2712864 RepID=UPI0013EAA120|nr:formylmethanofuran dehydrogenase subunit C [Aquisphaera insulae]
MSLTLTWLAATSLPVDGAPLRPDSLLGLGLDEVRRVSLKVGNRPAELGELFEVRGDDGGDDRLTVVGDLRGVRGIARGMTAGDLVVRGDAGPELGAEMAGGTIELHGSAGPYAGAEMRGGRLVIRGAAGDFLGAAYPGSRTGMRDGVILVDGTAGDDVGSLMRRGLIAVRGDAGEGLGRSMIAGTVVALGDVGRGLGAGMKRGSLVLPGLSTPPESVLPPTFERAGAFSAPFLAIYSRQMAAWGFEVPPEVSSRSLDRYNGDVLIGGRGEVLAGLRGG